MLTINGSKLTILYQYRGIKGYFRTYDDSYKTLINSDGTAVTNRALAAGSDWYTDRVAEINGNKYCRVATNEWVELDKGNPYQPDATVIQVKNGTDFYDEHGKAVGKFANSEALKVDKVVDINGQQMYRVATDEYVLVSSVK